MMRKLALRRAGGVQFPYPEYATHKADVLNNPPQYGVLGQLHGTWKNVPGVFGIHTTPMPSPGTTSEQMFGAFHFKSQEYTEELKFERVPHLVRNRLGSNEQFNGTVKYDTIIRDRNNDVQHVENGMYLWLGDNSDDGKFAENPRSLYSRGSTEKTVKKDDDYPVLGPGAKGPRFVPPHAISRSGVIPHGATIHLFGGYKADNSGAPTIAPLWDTDSLSVNKTMGINITQDLIAGSRTKPDWTKLPIADYPPPAKGGNPNNGGYPDNVLDPTSGRAYFGRILNYEQKLKDAKGKKTLVPMWPYSLQPNLKLIDANANLKILSNDFIQLDTQQDTGLQGGILQNVGVDRYCKSVRMTLRMWIMKVQEADGTISDQLQYEQRVFFEFMFGSNGGTTRWPHIQANTLRRVRE